MMMRVMMVMTMTMTMTLLGLEVHDACSQGTASTAMSPMQAQTRSKMARAYQLKERGRREDAISVFKTVLKTDPGNSEALVELGYLYASLKQWPAAAKYLKLAVEQDPGNIRLRMDLGHVRASMKDFAGAAEQFRVAANEPGEFQVKAQEALSAMGANAQVSVHAGQRKMIGEGWSALRRGDRATARRKFEAALENDSSDASIIKQVGFLNLQDGRMNEAIDKFEAARALDAKDHFIALQLGYLYERVNKKERARDAFTAALASPDEKIRAAAQTALASSSAGASSTATSDPSL